MEKASRVGQSGFVGGDSLGSNSIQDWATKIAKKSDISSNKKQEFLAVATALGYAVSRLPAELRSKSKDINTVLEATCRELLYYKNNTANEFVKQLPEGSPLRNLYVNILGKFGADQALRKSLINIFEHTGTVGGFFQNKLNFDAGYTATAKVLMSLGDNASAIPVVVNQPLDYTKSNLGLDVGAISALLKKTTEIPLTDIESRFVIVKALIEAISLSEAIVNKNGIVHCQDYDTLETNFMNLGQYLPVEEYKNLAFILCQFHDVITCAEPMKNKIENALVVEFADQQVDKDIHRCGRLLAQFSNDEYDIDVRETMSDTKIPDFVSIVNFIKDSKLHERYGCNPEDLAIAISFSAAQSVQDQIMQVLGLRQASSKNSPSAGESARRIRINKTINNFIEDKRMVAPYKAKYQASFKLDGRKIIYSLKDMSWSYPYATEVIIDCRQVKYNGDKQQLELQVDAGNIKTKSSLLMPRLISRTYKAESGNIWEDSVGSGDGLFENTANKSLIFE